MAKKSTSKFKANVPEILALVGGAIVASKVANLPQLPEKIRPILPLALGIVLAGNKNPMVKNAALAMIAVGGTKTIGAFVPKLGIGADEMMSGEMISDYEIVNGIDSQYALAGASDEYITGPMQNGNSNFALAGTDNYNSDLFS